MFYFPGSWLFRFFSTICLCESPWFFSLNYTQPLLFLLPMFTMMPLFRLWSRSDLSSQNLQPTPTLQPNSWISQILKFFSKIYFMESAWFFSSPPVPICRQTPPHPPSKLLPGSTSRIACYSAVLIWTHYTWASTNLWLNPILNILFCSSILRHKTNKQKMNEQSRDPHVPIKHINNMREKGCIHDSGL